MKIGPVGLRIQGVAIVGKGVYVEGHVSDPGRRVRARQAACSSSSFNAQVAMFYIPVAAVRLVQRHLKSSGYRPGDVDGDLGPNTEAALDRLLADRADDLEPEDADAIRSGSRKRKLTATVQLLADDAGINAGPIDGLWGPQTDYAFNALQHVETYEEPPRNWRDSSAVPNPHGWPVEREEALIDFYGAPGEHQTMIALPYPHRLAWDKRQVVSRTQCHERVADSVVRVLENVHDHYGMDRIRDLRLDLYGGCFNKRRKRGGSEWSTHAWGIALDYDPEHNRLQWGRDRASFAKPDYDAWWSFWEDEGWISLGRAKNFDWMHVQAARVP
jgi:hypothetical protein